MSYIPVPVVTEALTDQLRHCLRDKDAYVRKTASICVVKIYTADPRRAEKEGFVEMLRDLLLDPNATVVANAIAALCEIGDRPDGVFFKLNASIAAKLVTALGESSECVDFFIRLSSSPRVHTDYAEDGDRFIFWILFYGSFRRSTLKLNSSQSASSYKCSIQIPLWCSQPSKSYYIL
jgi:AP-2 complex subunit beta-1